MAVVLDEHKSYQDSAGIPLSGGFLTFGVVNADPVANPIVVYSDREFQTALTNPVTLDSSGRSPTKIWVDGKYSLRVSDSADVQIYQDLDNGEDAGGLTSVFVTSISGSDVIVGTTSEGLTSYTADQTFQFTTAVSPNTTAVTLNIDGVGAKAVVKNHTEALESGDFSASQSIIVMYNSITDSFEWQSQKTGLDRDTTPQLAGPLDTNQNQVRWSLGATLASASTLTLGNDGNEFNVTGTSSITAISSVGVGTRIVLQFASSLTLVDSTELELLSGSDIVVNAGDVCEFYQKSLTGWRMISYGRQDGEALVSTIKAWVKFNGTGVVAINGGFNVSSITDHGTGNYSVNYTNAIEDENYSVSGMAARDGIAANGIIAPDTQTPVYSTTATRFLVTNDAAGVIDSNIVTIQVVR